MNTDLNERIKIYKQAQEMIIEQYAGIYMGNRTSSWP